MSLKYTEHGAPLKLDTIPGFVKSSAVLLLTAPYRLIKEVSIKLPFLNRKLTESVLTGAVIVGAVVIVLTAVIQIFFNCFTVAGGKMPLLAMCIGLAVLIAGCIVFNALADKYYGRRACLDFSTPTAQDRAGVPDRVLPDMPVGAEENNAAMDTVEVAVAGRDAIPAVNPVSVKEPLESSGLNKTAIPAVRKDAEDFINEELYDSQAVAAYHRRLENGVATLCTDREADRKFGEGDLQELIEAMDTSTDPSKFIPEEIIAHFAKESEEENDIDFIAELDLGVVPSDFTALT